jgi:hypothetical protein
MQVFFVGMTQSLPFYKEALGCWWQGKAQVDASNLAWVICYIMLYYDYICIIMYMYL